MRLVFKDNKRYYGVTIIIASNLNKNYQDDVRRKEKRERRRNESKQGRKIGRKMM